MAGGKGSRIQSVASSIPKPLIPINGKPILEYIIETLVKHEINDIVISVSYMADKIQSYFSDGSGLSPATGEAFNCHITYFYEKQPLGNAGAVFKLWERGELKDDFLMLIADAMMDVDFGRFIAFHRKKQALATIFTHPNSHPYDSGLIVANEDRIITGWLNKEDTRPQWYKNRVNAGLHILGTELLSLSGICPADIDFDHKVDLDRDILKPLISTGRIYAYDSPEYVKDMGTPERYHQVSSDFMSGKIAIKNFSNPQKAIFLERDGIINKYVGVLHDVNKFELLPGVVDVIKTINNSGYLAIVVTYQPVIAEDEVTVEELNFIHNKMETLLGQSGAYIDALYYCSYYSDKVFDREIESLKLDCERCKPKTEMLINAAHDFNIDLNNSWMIGGGECDIQAGKNAGCMTMLIGDKDFGQDRTVKSLLDVVDLFLDT